MKRLLISIVLALVFSASAAGANIVAHIDPGGGVSTGWCQTQWGQWVPHNTWWWYGGKLHHCWEGRVRVY